MWQDVGIKDAKYNPSRYGIKCRLEEWDTRISSLDEQTLLKMIDGVEEQEIYNTCAIEGNSLTQLQVYDILNKTGKASLDVSVKDVREIVNAQIARNSVYKLSAKNNETIFSQHNIKILHNFLMHGLLHSAGAYRDCRVRIGSSRHIPPDPAVLPSMMQSHIDSIRNALYGADKIHPILSAAALHADFESIHPFEDGNGRIGRLLMNMVLLWHGYPPCVIDFGDRDIYYRALEKYNTYSYSHVRHDVTNLARLILDSLDRWVGDEIG